MSVLDSPQFRTISVPTAGFLPQFCRLNSRHQDFLSTLGIHFFTDDGFDLLQNTVTHGHEAIDTGYQLTDHIGAQQQDMAGNFSFCRYFAQSF